MAQYGACSATIAEPLCDALPTNSFPTSEATSAVLSVQGISGWSPPVCKLAMKKYL